MGYFKEIEKTNTGEGNNERAYQKREELSCGLCFGNHATADCVKIKKILEGNNFSSIKKNIDTMGIEKIGDEGMQKVLNILSGDNEKQGEVLDSLIKYYNLIEKKTKQDVSGKNVDFFDGSKMIVNYRGDNQSRIKIDKKPFGFDKDFNQYVFRYHEVLDDGTTSPVTKVNKLNVLSYLGEDTQDKKNDIRRKISLM
jgi:hypothetical protein